MSTKIKIAFVVMVLAISVFVAAIALNGRFGTDPWLQCMENCTKSK